MYVSASTYWRADGLHATPVASAGGTLYHLLSRLRKLSRTQLRGSSASVASTADAPPDGKELEFLGKARIISYSQQVAAACSYLHKQAVVHRDLKSTNLLLSHDFNTLKGMCTRCSSARARRAAAA